MADIRGLCAVHYNLGAISSLADVTAPPYDVIDDEQREALLERSPHNVVRLDLPRSEAGDPYEHAASTLREWTNRGVLARDDAPSIWPIEQEYDGPDGTRRTRRGFLARVAVTEYGAGMVRPHERTQPGPKEDRLRLTRATAHNLSPIFSLHEGNAWPLLEPAVGAAEPWGEVTDAAGTTHRVWRIADGEVLDAVTARLADSELLIADGHHRYETARAYADEIGGAGDHRYTLMALVSLEDPGLTVFGYHRLLTGLRGTDKPEALAHVLRRHFEIEEVPIESVDPAGEQGVGVFGYIDAHFKRGFRLRLKDIEAVDDALGDHSEAYRKLDAAILEALVLRGALGMSAEDVEAKRGIAYTASAHDAIAALDRDVDAAFLMRPTPVDQVRAVAAQGETMPPKSTYFFPKLLTGLVFNPLG